jgi:hypothetical protein
VFDDSTKEESENKEPESSTLDQKYITWLRNKRPIAVVIAIGAVLLSGLIYVNELHDEAVKAWAWFFPAKETGPATFAVRIGALVQTDIPLFYIVRGATACSTPVLFSLSFTNLQTVPLTVLDYTVEARDTDEKWVKLPKLAMIEGQQIYTDTPEMGLERATLVDKIDPPPLDLQLKSTTILQPRVPIAGTAFFDYPFPHTFSDVRVTIKDTLGNRFTSDSLPIQPSNLLTGLSLQVNPHERLDLSKLYINNHCGR